jgi:PAS domain S-box-containing protein
MTATILIIDDNEDDRHLCQRALEDFGCHMELVSTAEAGLAHIALAKPDLILLDYNLPSMDGLGFMKQLAKYSDTHIPIIMLTGVDSAAVAVEAMKHGADDYLTKDIEGRYLTLLPGVVARVMAAHEQHEQIRQLRRETEALLHRNRVMMQNSMDGIHVMDMDGNIVEANDAFCRMLGYTREEAARLSVADWDAQWSAEELRKQFRELARKSAKFETVHRRKDGSVIDVEISASGIEIEEQLFIYASSRDITERKKVEAMLKQHKLVIDTSIDGFWVTDLQGNLLEANEAYAKMSGYTVAELVNMHVSQLESKEPAADVKAHIERLILQGYERFETRHRRKDGQEIDIEISVTYRADPGQLVAFCRDITERKQAEETIKNTLLFQQKLMDAIPSPIFYKDAKGAYIGSNKAFERYIGLPSEQLIGKTVYDISPVDLAERYDKADKELLNNPGTQSYEAAVVYSDGTRHDVIFNKATYTNYEDKVAGLIGVILDITERKQTELALRVAAATFEAQDAILITDAEANIIRVNRAFSEITGYLPEEVLGQNPRMMSSERQDRAFYIEMWQQLTHAGTWSGELWGRRKNGEIFPKWLTITAIRDERGETIQYVAIFSDITERKQAEQKLLLESEAEHQRAELLEQQFGHLLQGSFNEIYLFDADSLHFLLTSEGAEESLGYSEDELRQLTPPDLEPSFTRKSFEELIAPLRNGERQSLLFETFHRRKDGTTYPVEARLQLMESEPPVFMAIIQDITDRRLAENQLREFSTHLQNIREEEKASFAREIHDELGSTLAALKMDASWLTHKLSGKAEMLALQECTKSMSGLLDNMVIATRRIITDLRPTMLDDIGLSAALKWHADQFQRRTGIECRFVCVCSEDDDDHCEDYADKFDRMMSINLFRICQEALTNVSRHSGASGVSIELHLDSEEITLSISDNGRGLPEGHTIASTSHGMRGMRERAAQLRGKIEFGSPPGGGFNVTVILPLATGNKVAERRIGIRPTG